MTNNKNELEIAVREVAKCLLSKDDKHINQVQYEKVISYLTCNATQESIFGEYARDIAMYVIREAKQKCFDNKIVPNLTNILAFIDPEFSVRHAYNYCLFLENDHEESHEINR